MRISPALSILAFALFFLPAAAGESISIGYSCSNFDDTFQDYVMNAARNQASASGVGFVAKDAGEDKELQLRQIEAMLADKAAALVVVPVDTSEVDAIVAAADAAGVPLVFVNRNPYPGQRPPDNCFVICSDAYAEGETQMHYAGKIIGSMGHVVILQGILANEATLSRTQGVKDVIAAAYPELAIVAETSGNWRRSEARSIMETWLREYGREKMDAVIANNDNMALGALDALAAAGIDDVVVLGIDAIPEALQAVKEGRMTGTVLQDPVGQGRGAVEIALKALTGEKQAQNFILPSELVTRENVDHYLNR